MNNLNKIWRIKRNHEPKRERKASSPSHMANMKACFPPDGIVVDTAVPPFMDSDPLTNHTKTKNDCVCLGRDAPNLSLQGINHLIKFM